MSSENGVLHLSEVLGQHRDDGAGVLLKQQGEDSVVGEPHSSKDFELRLPLDRCAFVAAHAALPVGTLCRPIQAFHTGED